MNGVRIVGEQKIVKVTTYNKKQEAKIKKDKKRNLDPRLQNLNVWPRILNEFIDYTQINKKVRNVKFPNLFMLIVV